MFGILATVGKISVLTYNIAGLPQQISRVHPAANVPIIGQLIADRYDLVLIQEDWAYDAQLRAGVKLAHAEPPETERLTTKDGLARFSSSAFDAVTRVPWAKCNGTVSDGNDCLAEKGYDVATHVLAPGIIVDVYNFHMDAGRSTDDQAARTAQLEQLADEIAARSKDHAVIVAGDTNLWRDQAPLDAFLAKTGLTDSCRALSCDAPWRADRVMFRSGGGVTLTPQAWAVDATFVDASGAPLSDHRPIAVTFRWESR